MAVYVSKQAVTLATRHAAYERLCSLLMHLNHFGLNLVSIIRRPDNYIEVTLNAPLPAGQISHLGLMEP